MKKQELCLRPDVRRRIIANLEKHSERSGECLLWTGRTSSDGYSRLWLTVDGRALSINAYRAAWIVHRGIIPEGLVLDHLCRNRLCINLDHLEIVTNRTNLLRGVNQVAENASKTHCKHGHELTGDNLRMRKNGSGRECLTCKKEFHRIYGRKRTEKARAAKREEQDERRTNITR
jgi:hypothetical protein